MTVAVICTAILGLLVFGLGFRVSIVRGQEEVLSGTPDDPANSLMKTVRAHGNTIEYAPMLAVLFLYLGSQSPSSWVVWTIIGVTAARVSMVIGLLASSTLDKPHPLRLIGAIGTYVGGAALSVAAILTVAG